MSKQNDGGIPKTLEAFKRRLRECGIYQADGYVSAYADELWWAMTNKPKAKKKLAARAKGGGDE